jgi:transposase
VRQVRDLPSAGFRIVLELEVRRVACRRCGAVKRERLDFLADNPHFTKRFAFYVGRRCRQASIRDVAEELKLDWDTVKTLEMQYMRAQLKRAGTPGPRAIGIDEISVRKGHSYRIVVSDLVRKRPIWFGGTDRSEASRAGARSRFCWPPTSASTPPTSSRRPSASSGTTGARAGPGASSTTGEPASNGSASDPTSASPI